MNTRSFFAAAILLLGVTAPVQASVLSASGQAVRNRPADRLDYLRVTTVQNGLNASLQDMAEESATGPISTPVPGAGSGEVGYFTNEMDRSGGLGTDLDLGAGVFGKPGGEEANWGASGRGGRGGREGNRGGHRGRGFGRRGGAHAAPEPSTWMLLGAGLAMLGTYAVIRRRQTSIG